MPQRHVGRDHHARGLPRLAGHLSARQRPHRGGGGDRRRSAHHRAARPPAGRTCFTSATPRPAASGEAEWMFRGGWRLWIAPERRETTYALDNAPCAAEVVDGTTLRVTGPPQPAAGIQKVVEVSLDPQAAAPARRVAHPQHQRPPAHLRRVEPVGDAPGRPRLRAARRRAARRLRRHARAAAVELCRARRPALSLRRSPRADRSDRGARPPQPARPAAATTRARSASTRRRAGPPTCSTARSTSSASRTTRPARTPTAARTIEIYSSAEFLEVENLSPLTTHAARARRSSTRKTGGCSRTSTIPADEQVALATLTEYVDRTKRP